MFNLVSNIIARIFPQAIVAAAPKFVLGEREFNAHLYDYADELYSIQGEREHEEWLAEQAEIEAEWAAMSTDERDAIYGDFANDWYSNHPMAGEGRYGSICMALLPKKELN